MVSMSKAKMENRALSKRFYDVAMAAPSGDGWVIALDGKPVKTPARQLLLLRSKSIADAVAAEWRAQKTHINPDIMPLTRLASLTLDRAAHDRAAWITDMVRYAETDLVCYRAPHATSSPSSGELRKRQDAAFTPLTAWAAQTHDLHFIVTEGIMPIAQPPATLAKARALLDTANDAEITALAMMIPLLGSYLIAIALWKNRITVDQAIVAARLDETHHAEQWGDDAEAQAAWAAKERDIRAAAMFLQFAA